MKMGSDIINVEVHHMNDIEANFVLNETEYLGSMTFQEHNQQAIYSNIREIVEQQHSIFETLWSKSIPAEDIIKEIEQGIEREFIEVIADSKKATEIYLNLVKSLQKEGLLLFADSKAIITAEKCPSRKSILPERCNNKDRLSIRRIQLGNCEANFTESTGYQNS